MTSDYESKDPGVDLQQGYALTRLDMWIRFGSLHSVCPGDIGYNYRRCFGKESCHFHPWASHEQQRQWSDGYLHGFITHSIYYQLVFNRPQCIFNECAPCCLDLFSHPSRALRSSQQGLQMETACHHLCFQIFHITNKTHGFRKLCLACIWRLWSWELTPCVQELETLKSEVHSRLLELQFQACWKRPEIIWWIVMMWDLWPNDFS